MIEDYGEECLNCECWSCAKNDCVICKNCEKCNGNLGYSKWRINCNKYEECENQ